MNSERLYGCYLLAPLPPASIRGNNSYTTQQATSGTLGQPQLVSDPFLATLRTNLQSTILTSWGDRIVHRSSFNQHHHQESQNHSGLFRYNTKDSQTRDFSRHGSETAFALKVSQRSNISSTVSDSDCLCCCSAKPEPWESINNLA